MENNKKIMIISIIITVLLLMVLVIVIYKKINANNEEPNKKIEYIKTIEYKSENQIENNNYDKKILKTYEEYINFKNEYNITTDINEQNFQSNNYIIVFAVNHYCGGSINGIREVAIKDNKINIEIGVNGSCGPCAPEYVPFIIPIDKDKLNENIVVEDYNYVIENNYHCNSAIDYKPIIYLYPKETTNVQVKLLKSENLLTTYPKYENEWNVKAYKDGNLKDNKTGRSLYGLYWEGTNNESTMQDEGFIVKGMDTISFLEETLSKLGLTEREANEFIIYWLPKLEQNEYNYIHFSGIETLNKIMPLEVLPKPDTTIRVLMEYKKLDKPIKLKKQIIETPKRQGFTLVEWGGTEIK